MTGNKNTKTADTSVVVNNLKNTNIYTRNTWLSFNGGTYTGN